MAPHKFSNVLRLPGTTAEVFEVVAGKDEDKWFPGFVSYKWETASPHGVGSIRDYYLKTLTIREKFLVWQPGERLTFCLTSCSLPLFRHFLEDYRITRISEHETRLDWNVYYQPSRVANPFRVPIRALYEKDFDQAASNISRYFLERWDAGELSGSAPAQRVQPRRAV